ncbi:helix-turn-helix domain-containing protein [Achromobacter mucicolens]|uniref:helix-turn-helix domain-containing protein n=1 Tax=Achromobacter mucicolens TaxID=1389922 RepID=UPI0020A568E0|nr:helix-turn-helix transcriptional regulator [Achromobacter mucicolens]MCP2517426.1 helix-turn-helix domain-containing protein [Achromobacter mucicolens]
MKPQTFGERLKESRRAANLTQKQVATKVGMAQATLSQLEGDTYPTSTYTPRLAHLYGVSARWLADGDGPRSSSEADAEPAATAWPFERVTLEQFASLPRSVKADIEDYIEMKISKAGGGKTPRAGNAAT